MEKSVYEMSFEELYKLIYGDRLKEYIRRESLRTGVSPSEIFYIVLKIYKEKAKDIALKN